MVVAEMLPEVVGTNFNDADEPVTICVEEIDAVVFDPATHVQVAEEVIAESAPLSRLSFPCTEITMHGTPLVSVPPETTSPGGFGISSEVVNEVYSHALTRPPVSVTCT